MNRIDNCRNCKKYHLCNKEDLINCIQSRFEYKNWIPK